MTAATDAVVIRIVYDGPPHAGKTTSVRALGRSFGREVITPEEAGDRTAYFDWLEYTGGRFDGAQIRCEVTSVPGQLHWAGRRAMILERADAVVFVGDTTRPAWDATRDRLQDLRARLDARRATSVGIVFQANKRDQPSAVSLAEIREHLAPHRIAVIESIAHEGEGIRETFVLAVRLALDHLRELGSAGGRLPLGTPEELLAALKAAELPSPAAAPPEELLAALKAAELPSPAAAPSPHLEAVPRRIVAAAATGRTRAIPVVPRPVRTGGGTVRAPSHEVPTGCVWPPVDGRIVLHEAAALDARPRVTQSGDWVAGLGAGWRLHSRADAQFDDLEVGRESLLAWAREHTLAGSLLSRERCIVLSDTGTGAWRLWQIVKTHASLRERFFDRDAPLAADLRSSVLRATRLLATAAQLCRVAGLSLPCTVDSIGVSALDQPTYITLMSASISDSPWMADAEWVANDVASLLIDLPLAERLALHQALESVAEAELDFADGATVVPALVTMLGV